MTQFESRKQEIESAGGKLAFIAAEKRDGIWKPVKFLEKHPITSVFLLDEDRVAAKAYGLHHTTLIIDPSGSIRYIYRGDNQHDRAPLDDVIAALQLLPK